MAMSKHYLHLSPEETLICIRDAAFLAQQLSVFKDYMGREVVSYEYVDLQIAVGRDLEMQRETVLRISFS